MASLLLLGCGSSSDSGDDGGRPGADVAGDGSGGRNDASSSDIVDASQPPDVLADVADVAAADVTPDPDSVDVSDVAPDVAPDAGDDDAGQTDTGEEPDVVDPSDADDPTGLHGVQFVGPADGAGVRGSIVVSLEPGDLEEWPGPYVSVRIDGRTIFRDKKLPTQFVLDTTYYPNGVHELEALVQAGEESESTSIQLSFENPSYRFEVVELEEYNYADGDTVNIDVNLGEEQVGLQVTADFSAVDSGYEAGAESVNDLGDGRYRISYAISAGNTAGDGEHVVPIRALRAGEPGETGADAVTPPTEAEPELVYRSLRVRLRNAPPVPIEVTGGIYVDEPLPAPLGGADRRPSTAPLAGSNYLITGGSANVQTEAQDPQGLDDVIGLVVGMQGYSGYFHIPLPEGGGPINASMRLDPNAGVPNDSRLQLRVASVDRSGNVSDFKAKELRTIQVLSGDVQVSVFWDTETDVDLHVLAPAPNGGYEELYYGDKTASSGGQLDLDANAACSIQSPPVNNENVSWPAGQSPAGDYKVLLDYWSSCGGQSAVYTVTVKNCGRVTVYNGTFHASDSSGGGECGNTPGEWASEQCALVAEFDNTCGYVAEGFVRYEDREFSGEGFRARTWKPLRYATVEVRRAVDGQPLGYTTTDRFGFYHLNFENAGEPGYYIVVKTQTNNEDGLRDVTVYNHPKFSRIYEFTSGLQYEETGVPARIDLDVPIAGNSGACNIFDVALEGYDRVRRMTGKELGPLRLFWQTGADTTATLYCSPELFIAGECSPEDSLQIQGLDSDRDEFDDCVILRQLYKFAERKISATNNPGGDHDGTRDDPRRSWSEGFATFFSSQTRRSPVFVDTNANGVYRVQNLEAEGSPFSFRTSSGSQKGYVSEMLVSAMLWDLADGVAGGEDDDPVIGNPNGVFDAAFNYLGGDSDTYVGGRGFIGRDFVDFLDGWFCRGHAQEEGVRGLCESREFAYDFTGPETCP